MKEAKKFYNTNIYYKLQKLETIYQKVDELQHDWIEHSPSPCPSGCGICCHDFEPDVLGIEALYLAVWMSAHQPEVADKIFDGTFVPYRQKSRIRIEGKGCMLFDPENPYHCTVYEGRPAICRLFAHSGDHGKNGELRWKPCALNPVPLKDGFFHRQYNGVELMDMLDSAPPAMSDIMTQIYSLEPDHAQTELLSEALPAALKQVKLLLRFINPPDPERPNPAPQSPAPLSA